MEVKLNYIISYLLHHEMDYVEDLKANEIDQVYDCYQNHIIPDDDWIEGNKAYNVYNYIGLYFKIRMDYIKMEGYYQKAIDHGVTLAMCNMAIHYERKYNANSVSEYYYKMSLASKHPRSYILYANYLSNSEQNEAMEEFLNAGIREGISACYDQLKRYYHETKNWIKLLDLTKRHRRQDYFYILNNELQLCNEHGLNEIANLSDNDLEFADYYVKTIHKLLKSKLDLMDLHFEYTIHGKGYEEAKADFIQKLKSD